MREQTLRGGEDEKQNFSSSVYSEQILRQKVDVV